MKATVLLILIVTALAADTLLLVSDPSTTTVLLPVGQVVLQEGYHTSTNPNYIGNGPQWIYLNVPDSRPVGEEATFQALFTADCPNAQATLTITADNLFTAYLNGQPVGNGNDWFTIYTFTVPVVCGVNNLTVAITNQDDGSPAALIFKIEQCQAQCYQCSSSAHYNRNTCGCQCDATPCSACPTTTQKWFDYPSCGCKCVSQPFTVCNLNTQYYDQDLCACKCQARLCPSGQEQDPASCSCKCKSQLCAASLKWNYDSCACELCTQTAPCVAPKIWNSSACGCV